MAYLRGVGADGPSTIARIRPEQRMKVKGGT
jgi:hypothetical protein